jgi:hypothetical protein
MRNPSGGHGRSRSVDRTVIDGFVREYLATVLMLIEPRDGAAEDPENNWCLADGKDQSVLYYSLRGPSIRLSKALSQGPYHAVWFDPPTGDVKKANAPITAAAGAVIPKPSDEAWLVLLRAGR